jgi:UDP:flavonoid glycosyltransferase YjiC (YdhE family)
MKIVLATFGSRGDVQPMLALSLALKSEGHDVLLAAPPEKAAWAKQLGCPFYPLGSDVTAFIDNMDNAHTLRSAICFVSFLRNELNSQFSVFPKIIADSDLLIGSSLTFALSTLAESMGIAYRFIAFAPQLLPSGHYPFPAFKHQRFPMWYNLDQYYWGNQIYQSQLGPSPIWRSELTSTKLAAAIRQCLSNEQFRQKARDVAGIIKQQDGLELTVREITGSKSKLCPSLPQKIITPR